MNPHLQPWMIASEDFPAEGYESDRLEFLLHYAILAPSPHNTQPWYFRLNISNIEIYGDPRRALRVVDPRHRELHIACGAALHNLRVAAAYFGQGHSVEILPDPRQPALLARFTLSHKGADTRAEDVLLFNALTARRTNRGPFLPDPIPVEVLAELAEAATTEGAWLEAVTADDGRRVVADLVALADRSQWSSREFRHELASWVRTDAEHQADGIPTRELGLRDWMSFAGPALVRTFNRGNNQAARDAEIATQSPALVVLGTARDDPRAWLEAGQALESVWLRAQAAGVAVSHLNQPIEVDELRARLAASVGRQGHPQILLRLGYGSQVPPTPRRGLRSVLLKQDASKAPPH